MVSGWGGWEAWGARNQTPEWGAARRPPLQNGDGRGGTHGTERGRKGLWGGRRGRGGGGGFGLEEEGEGREHDERQRGEGGAEGDFAEELHGQRMVAPSGPPKKWILEMSRVTETSSSIFLEQEGATRAVKEVLPVLA